MLASEEADAAALEAVENLLESYFVQVDSTFDKLEAVGALLLSQYAHHRTTRFRLECSALHRHLLSCCQAHAA